MYRLNRVIAVGSIVTCFLIQAQGADKYADENRPYEFGFTIDGEQHRHEKKDKNGIIMGEFGFITADGVYHVTVYATDEQGRFKILSMKNIRVQPYPTWHPKNSERQGHSLSLPPSQGVPASQALSSSLRPPENQFKQVSNEPPANSCSHCSLPTTTTRAPQVAKSSPNQQNYNNPSNFGAPGGSSSQSEASQQNTLIPQYPQQASGLSQNYPPGQFTDVNRSQSFFQQIPGIPQKGANTAQTYPQQGSQTAQNYPQNSFNSLQTSYQQGLRTPEAEANTAQTYPQQDSGPAHNYPTEQQNNLNNPQTSSQQGFATPQQGINTAQTYPQQDSRPELNYPTGQQNSLNSPQTSFQQALRSPQLEFNPRKGSGLTQNYPAGQQNNFNIPQTSSQQELGTVQYSPQQQSGIAQNYPQGTGGPEVQGGVASQYPGQEQNQNFQTQHLSATGERTPKQLNGIPEQPFDIQSGFSQGGQPLSKKPTLIAAQMQIVDKNTDIYRKGPGEKEGLPEGIKKDDITQLLYTFNYTLGFQGHFEEGYTNGVKQGYYFVTGRNGVRTRVDYIADAKGFRPKITQDVLDLLSDDVPKPETEKDEQYGLKGYEFKWLYYPVETKTR